MSRFLRGLTGLFFLIPVNPHIRSGYTNQWSLNIQHEITKDLMAEVRYVGSSSHKLGGFYDLNVAPPGPGAGQPRRPYPQYTSIFFWNGSNNASYEGLQIQVQKRYSDGLTLLSGYAWSKTIDDGSFSTGNGGFRSEEHTSEPQSL